MSIEETTKNLTRSLTRLLNFDWKDNTQARCLIHDSQELSRQLLICQGEGWTAKRVPMEAESMTGKNQAGTLLHIQKTEWSWKWNGWLNFAPKEEKVQIM